MIISKIKETIAKLLNKRLRIKHIYYYVPQCPMCKSWKTGRYMRQPMDPLYTMRKSLEHGELVRFVPREPIKNCYCTECGYEWGAHIEMKLLTSEEIMEQQRKRDTHKVFFKFQEENYVHGRPPRASLFNRWFL